MRLHPVSYRVLCAMLATLGILALRHRLVRMDERFIPITYQEAPRIIRFLLEDYAGYVAARQRQWRADIHAGWRSEDAAYDAFFAGQLDQAAMLAQQAAAAGEEESLAAERLLADIAIAQRLAPEALAHAGRVLQKMPDDIEALLICAMARTQTREYGEALEQLKRALRTGTVGGVTTFHAILQTISELKQLPVHEQPACLLAHYYRYLRIIDPGQAGRVRRYAQRAIRQQDHADDAYLSLGILQHKQNKPRKALALIDRAIEENPANAEALRWAAVIHADQGNLLAEYERIRDAFEASGREPFYWTHLEHVLLEKLGDASQALGLLEGAVQQHPDDARLWARLAYCHGLLGRYEPLIEAYQRAITLSPWDGALYDGLGFGYERSGRLEQAQAAFLKSAEVNPHRPEPYSSLGALQQNQHHYREAIAFYERALKLGDDDIETLAGLCATYHTVSAFSDAAACWKEVLARDPSHTLAQRLLPETLNNLAAESRAP